MYPHLSPIWQALYGTLMTWGITALGGACVVVMPLLAQALGGQAQTTERKILDSALGFASGVMLAASFWSLLEPAVEMARENPVYGDEYAWFPPAFGFALGGLFIVFCDRIMSQLGIGDEEELLVSTALGSQTSVKNDLDDDLPVEGGLDDVVVVLPSTTGPANTKLRKRRPASGAEEEEEQNDALSGDDFAMPKRRRGEEWKRVLLLVLAVTVHNFPEGLAVGVGFGSVGKSATATFERARNLAIGIGLQNFPEGLAVSMPLYRAGQPLWKCVFWGQMSGMVEPIGGLLGAWSVTHIEPLLPYALAFAAGAMIFVVVDSLVPEVVISGNRSWGTAGAMVGFLVMMVMDVAL